MDSLKDGRQLSFEWTTLKTCSYLCMAARLASPESCSTHVTCTALSSILCPVLLFMCGWYQVFTSLSISAVKDKLDVIRIQGALNFRSFSRGQLFLGAALKIFWISGVLEAIFFDAVTTKILNILVWNVTTVWNTPSFFDHCIQQKGCKTLVL